MKPTLAIILTFGWLFIGTAAPLPPLESSDLIEQITNAYAKCLSFEDSGSIREAKTGPSETNVSDITFHTEFLRTHTYRLELHSVTTYGVGPYSIIYYWDGRNWSSYDSIDLHNGVRPAHTNANEDILIGSGSVLSHGLFPETAKLLHIKEGLSFSGFHHYDSATTAVESFQDKPVYRLTLHLDLFNERDTIDYWVDPQSHVILREHEIIIIDYGNGGNTETTTRDILHSPKLNAFAPDKMIEFSPPQWTLPLVTYSGGNGSSPQEAVIIKGVSNEDAAFQAEIVWRRQHLPDFDFQDRDQIESNGKQYDVTLWTNAFNKMNTIYFELESDKK